jgi:hypothetical protein
MVRNTPTCHSNQPEPVLWSQGDLFESSPGNHKDLSHYITRVAETDSTTDVSGDNLVVGAVEILEAGFSVPVT